MNSRKRFRPDIQAIRALAVMLVLVFHLWPSMLPAGYIGVDIFFVISGYLITGVLFREYQESGQIRYLRFYLHRFRRLMPAASLVILLTVVFSFALDPPYKHQDNAIEAVASALYFQNWVLAWRATDYLAAEESLGPLMHYWSLSVEEQFYLIWPGAMVLGIALAKRLEMSARHAAILVIAMVSGVSLAASVWYGHQELAQGYFVTHTRLWELGIGALLALARVPVVSGNKALLLYVFSLGVIILCAFFIPIEWPFPGVIALVPTLSCAVLIHCGAELDGGLPGKLFTFDPIQKIGDASYSIYLWHWPLIYFLTLQSEPSESIGLVAGLSLMLVSVLAGMASKFWVEDRYRAGHASDRKTGDRAAINQTAAAFALSIALGGALYWYASAVIEEWKFAVAGVNHPGAMALTLPDYAGSASEFIPPVALVKQDLPVVYDNGCHIRLEEETAKLCELNRGQDGRPVLVLVGDSHAANWVPMVRAAAEEKDWRFVSATASACSLTYPPEKGKIRQNMARCIAWSEEVLEQLRTLKPDVVILARSRRKGDYTSEGSGDWVRGLDDNLETVLQNLSKLTGQIIVIPDTPRLKYDLLECLARSSDCTVRLQDTIDRPDALLAAAINTGSAEILDLRDIVCPAGECPALIGNVVVWRDLHHLTATFSRSIGPIFIERVEPMLPD